MAGEGHIPLAASPGPASAAPITGLVEKAEAEFGFAMAVTRVRETPRVTKPYTERQWQDILAQGERVERALKAGDVRLTMGGEPTFIAAGDMDAPEWNTDALGPAKRRHAGRRLRRLAGLWSPGAALQYGMGKQYPGDQLPRWALHAHWRRDGELVWRDPGLLASDDDTDTATAADAARFAGMLAERLQVDPSLVNPARGDIPYYLWREGRLPANVVAEDAKLRDPLEALACAGQGAGRRRHRPLCRQQHGPAAGSRDGLGRGALYPGLQRIRGSAGADRHPGRACRRHPLQGLGPALGPAPDHPRPGAAGLRPL
ncbi:MAG: Large protein containing transglutaminase-like domain [uncultured Craurococcus sp.]|uniref:Large protein containing transglutaminase-like domain n=1 Tax=uncultured Craurococcus sp. TaxID=1135998 RepID=A0A6J4IAM1_9PROT|nr:MAG: Large protein containing transglutaminase-like domain [uncultured Craurococcus sp.]